MRLKITSLGVAATALLAACAADQQPPAQPSFYTSLAKADSVVDAQMAASMISGYRANQGLPPLVVDPELTKLALAQAQAMAARDRVDPQLAGTLKQRVGRAGFDPSRSSENVSAGYHTLAEAFSGWRDSPRHRATMLSKDATHMGIATAYAPGSKYRVFWSLIVATPGKPPG